jgi:Kef-type K+ transport system membrane component KefB
LESADQPAVTLLVFISAAFVLPFIAEKIRVPAVVLEIAFGIVIGPVTNVVEAAEYLDVLADLGFLLLMFLAGFEIDVRIFSRRGLGPLMVGLTVFAFTLGLSYVAATRLDYGLFMVFVLATTSVGLVVPTLRTTRHAGTRLGQAILVSALLADLITLVGVTVVALTEQHGVGLNVLAMPAFFTVVTVSLLLMRRLVWWKPEWFERLFETDHPEELGTRASLTLMLVFVGASIAFGIEPILGAFLAGTGFAMVFRNRGVLGQQLSGFSYGFLIPIFFINVGMHFDIDALRQPGAVGRLLALIGVALAVKMGPALVLLARRHTLREVMAAGALLSARLSLIIAVAEVGLRLGLIDRPTEASIVVLAAVTSTFGPVVFRWLAPPPSESRRISGVG